MAPDDQEDLAYLQQVLVVLQVSLTRESDPVEQEPLRGYISDIEQRIARTQAKA